MTTKKSDEKVAKEVAENEFNRFTHEMGIDTDASGMDEEDLSGFNKQKNRIIGAIQDGSLVINENGEAVFTPQRPKSKTKDAITFHERTGASLMAMDSKKKNQNVAKMYAVLADMCEVHPKIFSGLAGLDIKICEALFALLMD